MNEEPKLKLFHVTCTIDVDMVVLAEDRAHAERLGERNWSQEVQDACLMPDRYHASEITDRSDVSYLSDEDLQLTLPYGPDGIWENGSSSPQLSIAEYMKERGIQ